MRKEPWCSGRGNRQLATGNRKLATGNWQPVTGNWQPATGNWQPATGNRQPATGNRQLETGNRQLETGNWQPATGNRPLETGNRQLVTKVVASRSHMNEETKNFIEKLGDTEVVSAGSSLKFMLLAEGKADLYPRFGPTMEWDTAAAHGILKELGLQVVTTDSNTELVYNKENLLNPYFIAGNR